MKRTMRNVCLTATILNSAWPMGLALAQNASDAQIEEVVVTGRKREEAIGDVPVAITAITATTMERAGITSLQTMGTLVPSFTLTPAQDPGTNVISIRGITQVRFGEPPVALVVDGVQASSPDEGTQDLYDIERIEILKGPQGSTYGRNAIGGAINIVTKAPTNDFENEVSAEFAEGFSYRLSGASSGPVVEDKLLYRVSASYKNGDGRIRNVTRNEKADGYDGVNVRGKLIYTPSDRLTFDLRGNFEDFDGGSAYYYPIFAGQDTSKVYPVVGNRNGVGERRLRSVSLKADFAFDTATLTSVSSYAETRAATLGQDLDFLAYPLSPFFGGLTLDQTRNVKAWSEEIRLTSTGSGPLKWLVGAYYLNTHRDVATRVFLDLGPTLGPRTGPVLSFLPEQNRNNAYAVFGNADYDITDALKLSLGLRQDWDVRDQTNPVTLSHVEKTFKNLQPKASLSYFFAADKMVYASAGRGFRSGGFNVQSPIFPREFGAETANTYEIGTKNSFNNRRLQMNAAVFYTDQRNIQIFQFDAQTGTQGISVINKAHHYGVEADMRALVTDNLEFSAGGSVIGSKITDYNGTATWRGNKLPHVNGWSYNVGVQYNHDIGAETTFHARVDYNAFGNLYWFADNLEKLGSTHLVNVRMSLDHGSWEFTLFADNVFNHRYNTDYFSALFAGSPTDIGYPNDPRRFGGKIAVKF